MFKLAQSETYKWPVKVSIPMDGGRFQSFSFTGLFRRVPLSRMEELVTTETGDRGYATEVLAGWGEDLVDVHDEPVPFSKEALAALLDTPGVAAAIVVAYAESVAGAPRKN